jgi:diaminopimelate epimerase
MKGIRFTKMVGSGNDFVVIEKSPLSVSHSPQILAREMCDRKFGLGADGLLLLERTRKADCRMRIINADGSEAEMCGNGARCVALWLAAKRKVRAAKFNIETKAGTINAEVSGDTAKIKLTEPRGLKLDIPIAVEGRKIKVNFVNTGVPHTVIFVNGLDGINVARLGKVIRFHRAFAPAGTNVDFVQAVNTNNICVRTYERGVEDETLACGTGAVASAIIFIAHSTGQKASDGARFTIRVRTRSHEILKVYFEKMENQFTNIWLEGKARIVGEGVYYV